MDAAGRFSYIGAQDPDSSGREKCSQDVANTLLQVYNPLIPWGSFLSQLDKTGSVLGTTEHHKLRIHTEVSDAIQRLMALQEADENITEDEKIARFSVIVEESSRKLTYNYYLSVHTEAGDTPLTKAFEVELKHRKDPNLDLDELLAAAQQLSDLEARSS